MAAYRTTSTLSTLPVGTSVSEKRTIITSSSSSYDEPSMYYRSSITPRSSSIQRISTSGPISPGGGRFSGAPVSPGGTLFSRSVDYISGASTPFVTNDGVVSFKTSREREKQDLRDLNERFANYIEKVRFLEAQNRKLAGELDELRSQWGRETSAVKSMYGTELGEARKVIEDTNKDRGKLQVRIGQLEEEIDELQKQ